MVENQNDTSDDGRSEFYNNEINVIGAEYTIIPVIQWVLLGLFYISSYEKTNEWQISQESKIAVYFSVSSNWLHHTIQE